MESNQKTWVIGDLHSCLEEFNELLDLIDYKSSDVRIILVGDLYDRGPFHTETVRRCKELNLECVSGNHEQKFLKWLKNKGSRSDVYSKLSHYDQFSDDDINYMMQMPLYIKIPELNTVVVHAGVRQGVSLENQSVDDLCYTRFLDDKNNFLSLRKIKKIGSLEAAKGHFWTDHGPWDYNIIYGHQVWDEPRIDVFENGTKAIGIDCGAVFGGKLVSYCIETGEFISVKAKKIYYQSTLEVK